MSFSCIDYCYITICGVLPCVRARDHSHVRNHDIRFCNVHVHDSIQQDTCCSTCCCNNHHHILLAVELLLPVHLCSCHNHCNRHSKVAQEQRVVHIRQQQPALCVRECVVSEAMGAQANEDVHLHKPANMMQ